MTPCNLIVETNVSEENIASVFGIEMKVKAKCSAEKFMCGLFHYAASS
jgi:hypothetical protein